VLVDKDTPVIINVRIKSNVANLDVVLESLKQMEIFPTVVFVNSVNYLYPDQPVEKTYSASVVGYPE
jgi:hypothetical protein